jgi:hypothetical protein
MEMEMKNSAIQRIIYGCTGLAAFFLLLPSAMAIGIRPLRYETSVAPGGSVKSEVTVVNETNKAFMAEPIIKVFYTNDETGLPVYLNQEEQLRQNKIEDFASWIKISKDPVSVPAKGEIKVPYTVNVPKNATAGGKYALIAYQPVKEETGGVAVNVRAASLLYINVEGEVVRSGELIKFSAPEKPTADQPFVFDVSFSNTGNTHLKPTGWIEVTNLLTGKKLKGISEFTDPETMLTIVSDTIPVNINKSSVLPGSLRTFKSEWKYHLAPGKFRANLNLTYAEGSPTISQSLEFSITNGQEATSLQNELTENAASFSFAVFFGLLGAFLFGMWILIRKRKQR